MTIKSREVWDPVTQTLHIERVQDVEENIEYATMLRNNGRNGFSPSRNWRKIGSIPLVFYEKVLREKGINMLDGSPEAAREVRKFLNEHSKFKTVDQKL